MVALAALKGDKNHRANQLKSSSLSKPKLDYGKNKRLTIFLNFLKTTAKKKNKKEADHQSELENLYKIIGQREIETRLAQKKNYQFLTNIDKKNEH